MKINFTLFGKISFLCSFFFVLTTNAQTCNEVVPPRNPNIGIPPGNASIATFTAQTFTPTCSGKLTSIAFTFDASSDDLRNTTYFIKCNIRNNSGLLLGTGNWVTLGTSTDPTRTDHVYGTSTNAATFNCVYLTSGTQYKWEIEVYHSNPASIIDLILFAKSTTDVYLGGDLSQNGTVTLNKDFLGWNVLIDQSYTALSATQSQTNPTSAVATDGSASVTPSGGFSTSYSYVWKKNGTVISGATTSAITNQGVGTYTVDITNTTCINTITKTFNLQFLSTNEFEIQSKLRLYPNPTNDIIHISFENLNNTAVTILDLNGRVLKTQKLEALENKISISDLNNGIYLFKIQSEEGSVTKQIIKN